MKIIGVAGKAGAGKDTVGEIISNYLRSQQILHIKRNFADSLKEYCREKYGLTWDQMYTEKGKSSLDIFWGVTPRQILQFEGTEATRNIVGQLLPDIKNDFWIRRLELWLDREDGRSFCEYAIVCDVRFQNEADWVLKNGLLINVLRAGTDQVGILNHASEAGFQVQQHQFRSYYEVTNDGTIEQLTESINSLLKAIL